MDMKADHTSGVGKRAQIAVSRPILGALWAAVMAVAMGLALLILDRAAFPAFVPFAVMTLAGLIWGFWPRDRDLPAEMAGPIWPWVMGAFGAGIAQGGLGPLVIWCAMPTAASLIAGRRPPGAFVPTFGTLMGLTLVSWTPIVAQPTEGALSVVLFGTVLVSTLLALLAAFSWAPPPLPAPRDFRLGGATGRGASLKGVNQSRIRQLARLGDSPSLSATELLMAAREKNHKRIPRREALPMGQ